MAAASKYAYDGVRMNLDRIDRGLSVKQFARKAKLSLRVVYYFLDERVQSDDTAMALAAALGTVAGAYRKGKARRK